MQRAVHFLALPLLALAACQPPASDEYVERSRIAETRSAPSNPIASPDTENAVWAEAESEQRIVYGAPGDKVLFALACETDGPPRIVYTRHAAADADAQAILALIGNGHVSRLAVDAEQVAGGGWLWRGRMPADDPALDVLTGVNRIEATVPGAGSVILNSSGMPGRLIAECRRASERQNDSPVPPANPA